jgi:hypothetical protein
MRMDWLEFKLWVQGDRDPIVLRFDGPEGYGRLDLVNVLFMAPNLFLSTSAGAALGFATRAVTDRVVFRVDVEMAFASFASSVLLPGAGSPIAMASAEATVRQMEQSFSWRITAPLRRLKRLVR